MVSCVQVYISLLSIGCLCSCFSLFYRLLEARFGKKLVLVKSSLKIYHTIQQTIREPTHDRRELEDSGEDYSAEAFILDESKSFLCLKWSFERL
ncbi:hypothetical protein V6Z11_D13G186800 [Gossypium hirsutum]